LEDCGVKTTSVSSHLRPLSSHKALYRATVLPIGHQLDSMQLSETDNGREIYSIPPSTMRPYLQTAPAPIPSRCGC
jgi:hypothetical protein